MVPAALPLRSVIKKNHWYYSSIDLVIRCVISKIWIHAHTHTHTP